MDLYSVNAITATVGGPSVFVLSKDSQKPDTALSSSLIIQRLLLEAFFTGAHVAVELVPGSNVIKRVLPFETGKDTGPFSPGKYRVSRLATQQMSNGLDEHLEAFLIKEQGQETAYNVYDQLLQQVLEAAFGRAIKSPVPVLHVEFDGNEIATLHLSKV